MSLNFDAKFVPPVAFLLKSMELCLFAIILAHRYLLNSTRKNVFYPLDFSFCNSEFMLYKSLTQNAILY